MPPAKKPAARTSKRTAARPARRRATTRRAKTRREVEQATQRFEKALTQASDALQSIAKDMGAGAKGSYADVTKALRALQRDAQRTNRKLIKDFEKLAAAAPTPRRATARAKRSGTASKAAKRSTTAKRTGSRAGATRRTASRRRSS